MDSESKFWVCCWALGLVGFIVMVGCITAGGMRTNELYYRAQSECIAKAGTWLPIRDGVCMGAK